LEVFFGVGGGLFSSQDHDCMEKRTGVIALDLQHLHVCPRALHVGTVYGYIVWLTATEYIEEAGTFSSLSHYLLYSFFVFRHYLLRGPGAQFVSIARQGDDYRCLERKEEFESKV